MCSYGRKLRVASDEANLHMEGNEEEHNRLAIVPSNAQLNSSRSQHDSMDLVGRGQPAPPPPIPFNELGLSQLWPSHNSSTQTTLE